MQFMRMLSVVLLCGLCMCAFANDSSKGPCTHEEAIQAEKDTDHLRNWDQVYRSYRRFSRCDDGAIGEGYSDAITKLLANKWEDFGTLAKLAGADIGFRRFVLKHVDQTVPSDTLGKIVENAKTRCPSGQTRFCRLVVAAASP
jgi:hypothetical protein